MGFLGFFNFALTCFDHLAWPLFALGYPLYASIRAIETNSNYHMRKLVSYWILFSLISLVELAFVKLIEWIPLWPYIKLGTICWLVLPRFNGSHYCYKSLIHPCLSLNLEQVMKMLYKRKKASVEKDNFLSAAERYVSENGTEALEKLIASKGSRIGFGGGCIKAVTEAEAEAKKRETLSMVKGPGTAFDVEETKAVAEAEKNEMPKLVKGSRIDLGVEKVKTVAQTEKSEIPPIVKSKGNEFKVDYKDVNKMEQPRQNAPVPENSVVKPTDPILLQAKQKMIETVEVKEMTKPPVTPAVTEEALPAKAPLEKVQKEWTCAVCQVTTTCEANLNSHLTGMKHRTKCEELKSKSTKPPSKSKAGPSTPASKWAHDDQGTKPDKVKKQIGKVQVKIKSEGGKQNADNNSSTGSTHLKCWCPYCSVTCLSEIDYMSHLNGKKHLARVQEMAVYPAAAQQARTPNPKCFNPKYINPKNLKEALTIRKKCDSEPEGGLTIMEKCDSEPEGGLSDTTPSAFDDARLYGGMVGGVPVDPLAPMADSGNLEDYYDDEDGFQRVKGKRGKSSSKNNKPKRYWKPTKHFV